MVGTKADKQPSTRSEAGTRERICRTVKLQGLTEIIFDRYAGDNNTTLEAHQKLYYAKDGSKTLVLPALNIMSFLSAQNTDSAPKRLMDSRKYKDFAQACRSFVTISPEEIPFTRDDEPIVFGSFKDEVDQKSGVYVVRHVARLDKGIPNPKVRPVLPLPWALSFKLTLFPNKKIQEQQLLNIFSDGGIALGLGTFRGSYGKFDVVYWE